jgi:hypothetical protein
MTELLADPALRLLTPRPMLLGTGDADSLQNVDTTELPNGALCWVVSNATLYRLDAASTAASAPDAVIVPASGPGRWFALSGTALLAEARMSEREGAELTLVVGAPNQGIWLAMPAGAYAAQVAGAAFWTVNAATGVATYSGPPQVYQFEVSLQVACASEIITDPQISLSVNGEDLGTNNLRQLFMATQVNDFPSLIALAQELSLDTGDTVQLIVRASAQPNNLVVGPMLITGLPVGTPPPIIV